MEGILGLVGLFVGLVVVFDGVFIVCSMMVWRMEGILGLVGLLVGLVVVFDGVFIVVFGVEGVLSLLAEVTSTKLSAEVVLALFLAGVTSVES